MATPRGLSTSSAAGDRRARLDDEKIGTFERVERDPPPRRGENLLTVGELAGHPREHVALVPALARTRHSAREHGAVDVECGAGQHALVRNARVIPLSREACGPNRSQRCLLPRCLRDRVEKGCRRDVGTNRVEVAHVGGVPVVQREVPLIVVATGDPRAVGLRGLDRGQVEEVTAGVLAADQRVQPLPRDVLCLVSRYLAKRASTSVLVVMST
jgi:hypothetical protein